MSLSFRLSSISFCTTALNAIVFVPLLPRTSLRPLLQTRSSSSYAVVSYVCVQLLFEWFRRQCTLYLRLQKLSCLVPSANSRSKQKLITKRCRNCNSVSNELIDWKQETTSEEKMHRKESDISDISALL